MKVPAQNELQEKEIGRIVLFPTRSSAGKGAAGQKRADKADLNDTGIADLRKYERSTEPDDYPRRMAINIIAFGFIVVLTLAGIWLAEQLALSRKQQDCLLSGRRNCAPLDVTSRGH